MQWVCLKRRPYKRSIFGPYKRELFEPYKQAIFVPYKRAVFVPYKRAIFVPYKRAICGPYKRPEIINGRFLSYKLTAQLSLIKQGLIKEQRRR